MKGSTRVSSPTLRLSGKKKIWDHSLFSHLSLRSSLSLICHSVGVSRLFIFLFQNPSVVVIDGWMGIVSFATLLIHPLIPPFFFFCLSFYALLFLCRTHLHAAGYPAAAHPVTTHHPPPPVHTLALMLTRCTPSSKIFPPSTSIDVPSLLTSSVVSALRSTIPRTPITHHPRPLVCIIAYPRIIPATFFFFSKK